MSELDFPVEEYRGRVAGIQGKMSEKGLDALIIVGAENIHYAVGYDCAWTAVVGQLSGVVVPAKGEPRIIVRSLESKTANKLWMKNPGLYYDWVGPRDLHKETLEGFGAAGGTIGVEENNITVARLNGLKGIVPRAKIVDASGLVESFMAHPSPLEVEYTRNAAAIAQAGLDAALATICEGTIYYQVVTKATEAMYGAGQTEQCLFGKYMLSLAWGGPDGGELHETNVTRKIEKGHVVTPEFWGTYRHYVGGAMASVYVGDTPPTRVADTYKVLAEMYHKAKEAMRPGIPQRVVWEAASEAYRNAYGADYFRMLGPQLGTGGLSGLTRSDELLEPGQTFMIQPEVTDPVLLVVCASLMVTENGCVELSTPLLELRTI